MFKIRTYYNDGPLGHYWGTTSPVHKTHDEALVACFRDALEEAQGLNECCGEEGYWLEVETDFEITSGYENDCVELGTVFPVAVVMYDHAPWDRENDCKIDIVTGYLIEEVEE